MSYWIQVEQTETISIEKHLKDAMVISDDTARQVIISSLLIVFKKNIISSNEKVHFAMKSKWRWWYLHFQNEFGSNVPLYTVDATIVEPVFQKLHSYIFDVDNGENYETETDRPAPTSIFVLNLDKVCNVYLFFN